MLVNLLLKLLGQGQALPAAQLRRAEKVPAPHQRLRRPQLAADQ